MNKKNQTIFLNRLTTKYHLSNYDLIYRTFIMPNISLVISSECKAIKTIYLSYEEWEKIKTIETKKRYSYKSYLYSLFSIHSGYASKLTVFP